MNRIDKRVVHVSSVVLLATVVGCRGEQRAWGDAVDLGTEKAYEAFVARYPESDSAGGAR